MPPDPQSQSPASETHPLKWAARNLHFAATLGLTLALPFALQAARFPKREVDRHLTGHETEPWEILYFKAYKSQLAVIEQALETAALMLGTDKSRGYCLEMICADFLAGASLKAGAESTLFFALTRLIGSLPVAQRLQLLDIVRNGLEPIQTEVAAT